ncbi:MAG: hypothetical protein LVQ95_05615 [Candidatus Micrarchaeales archaeon]|nr:hypothetical protein [Candidatus Micrarchaeales archaeon]
MIIIEDLNRAFDVTLFRVKTATFRPMSIKESLAFYYKYSLPVLILLIIMSYALDRTVLSIFPGLSSASGVIVASLVLIWIAVPVLVLIQSAFLYVAGVLLKIFKNNFPGTFTAAIYGSVPLVLFLWLTSIPIYGKFVLVIIEIWSFVILVVALAEQHAISRFRALALALVANIIISLLFYGALSFLLPPLHVHL